MMEHSSCYWFLEFMVIFLADLAAAGVGYKLIEGRLDRKAATQRAKHMQLRLRSIAREARNWTIKARVMQGERVHQLDAPIYDLDRIIGDSTAWAFENSDVLLEAANSLFVALINWREFQKGTWNQKGASKRITAIADSADALSIATGDETHGLFKSRPSKDPTSD